MENTVDAPILNKGFSAGINQPQFGIRGADNSFPTDAFKWQSEPVLTTNGRYTFKKPIVASPGKWENRWDNGTILFELKQTGILSHMYCLSYARALMCQSAISMHLEKNKEKNKELAAATTATNPNSNFKTKARDQSFFAKVETIAEHINLAGIAIGPTEPGLQMGTTRNPQNQVFSGAARVVPYTIFGNAYMPNLFGGQPIRAAQDLFMVIKGFERPDSFTNPSGVSFNVTKEVLPHQLVPDIHFYTTENSTPPPRSSDTSMLYDVRKSNYKQPPRNDACYIEYYSDDRQKSAEIVGGDLKTGIVYKIGKPYHQVKGVTSYDGRFESDAGKPLPFSNDFLVQGSLINIAYLPELYTYCC